MKTAGQVVGILLCMSLVSLFAGLALLRGEWVGTVPIFYAAVALFVLVVVALVAIARSQGGDKQ